MLRSSVDEARHLSIHFSLHTMSRSLDKTLNNLDGSEALKATADRGNKKREHRQILLESNKLAINKILQLILSVLAGFSNCYQ